MPTAQAHLQSRGGIDTISGSSNIAEPQVQGYFCLKRDLRLEQHCSANNKHFTASSHALLCTRESSDMKSTKVSGPLRALVYNHLSHLLKWGGWFCVGFTEQMKSVALWERFPWIMCAGTLCSPAPPSSGSHATGSLGAKMEQN